MVFVTGPVESGVAELVEKAVAVDAALRGNITVLKLEEALRLEKSPKDRTVFVIPSQKVVGYGGQARRFDAWCLDDKMAHNAILCVAVFARRGLPVPGWCRSERILLS